MSSNKQVIKSIIVKGDVAHLYDTWKEFSNHPQFMENIIAVTKEDDETNHWVMEGPLNQKYEWTTKTTTLEPNKRIAWKTIQGDIKRSGQVTFNSLPKGEVEVTVTSQTIPPEDLVNKAIVRLFANEEAQWDKDLHNFKALIEGRTQYAK